MRKRIRQVILMQKGVQRQFWGPGRRKVRQVRKALQDKVNESRYKVAMLIMPEDKK